MAERSRRHGGEKLRKFAAVMVCLLMSGFWALPAHAAGCYPPPCAAPAGAPTLTANGQGAPLPAVGLKNGAGRTPAAPFVAVGLVMVATTFSTIALLRRLAVVRRSRPVPARTERKDGVGWAKAGKFARLVDR